MLQINKITIENFRGIKSPVVLDFVKEGRATSVLIYGRNGTGKSSIIDAWEWMNKSKIEFLSGEGVSERDYPHRLSNGDGVYIELDFNHPTICSVRATFNKARITQPDYSGQYDEFKAHCVYPNYLRYSDLQDFVFKTKGEKYRYIAKFFGLESHMKCQATLQSSLNRLNTQLQQFESELDLNKSNFLEIEGLSGIDTAEIIAFFNSIATKYGINEISELQGIQSVINGLTELIKVDPITLELTALNEFLQKLNRFYPLNKVVQLSIELETVFQELKQDEGNVTKLILIDLYSTATETLSKLEDKTICPVCDTVFDGDLENHILEKHKALDALKRKKEDFIKKRQNLHDILVAISGKLNLIHSESNEKIRLLLEEFFSLVDSVSENLPVSINYLRKPLNELNELKLSEHDTILSIDKLSDQQLNFTQVITDRITELSKDENAKKLAEDFTTCVRLLEAYKSFLKSKGKIDYLSGITAKMQDVITRLTGHIQNEIQSTFTIIQNDVVDCYNFLESSNQYLKNPEIKLVNGRDKAVELEIEFVADKVSPAFKYMSESQINSFGLAIFMSAVKHFNSDFKFMILDDVVNSFDAFKRPRVSQLIANKFSDFQVLMLTHDQIFFDTVQRDFPGWNRYKFASWDYTTGPRCNFSNNYHEEIEELIANDDPIGAGQKLGRYLEMVFGIINENLQTPIRYKLENIYTLSEFYDPLVKRVRDKLKMPNKRHKVSVLFSEFEQGTIFRNYCAHYKNEATQFTSPEIEAIYRKWIEIESKFYCSTCKTYASLIRSGQEYVKCSCGQLDLKNESFYID
jgi:hypothetical protein